MTLHDKLKEILEQFYNDLYEHWERGGHPDPTPSTISAIIQAVAERLPGEKEHPGCEHMPDHFQRLGWNAYREEVRKVLEEKL